jgi:SAM-dependent methyltransferase
VAKPPIEQPLVADYRSLVSPARLHTTPLEERESGLDDLPRLITAVSPNDLMYQADEKHYFYWGGAAIRSICWVLAALEEREPKSILDFPSGHGRVLRALKVVFPDAELTAGDVDRDAVNFCSSTFGAHPIYAAESPRKTVLGRQFDLIWCGSLITHLDEVKCRELLELLAASLAPSGVLVFTAHGPHYRSLLGEGKMSFHLRSPDQLLADYDQDGFGYQDYESQSGYGISLCSPTWVSRNIDELEGLGLDCYAARGWGGLHDVYGCVRG